MPGVQHAAHTLTIPFGHRMESTRLRARHRLGVAPGSVLHRSRRSWLCETMGTPLVRGRQKDADRVGSQPVVVLSQAAARRTGIGGRVRQVREAAVRWSVETWSIGISACDPGRLGRVPGGTSTSRRRRTRRRTPHWSFGRTRGDPAAQTETMRGGLQGVVPGFAYVSTYTLDTVVAPGMPLVGARRDNVHDLCTQCAGARGGGDQFVRRRRVRCLTAHARVGRARRAGGQCRGRCCGSWPR